MDATTIRRRQRRRAAIAWSTAALVGALVVVGIVFGGGDDQTAPPRAIHIFGWEMSSSQYEQIHEGEDEAQVLTRLGSTGLREDEVQGTDLLRMFPPPPQDATCSFWKLSDAPDHLVRLCFSEPRGVLLQKTVRAPGEGGSETMLA